MRKRVLDVRFHGDDPARESVMTASFLQAGLFTSVVAFGVAAMAFVLGSCSR